MATRLKILVSTALLGASIAATGCVVHRAYPGYYDDGTYRGASYSSGVYYGPTYRSGAYVGPRHYWGNQHRHDDYCWDRDGKRRKNCRG